MVMFAAHELSLSQIRHIAIGRCAKFAYFRKLLHIFLKKTGNRKRVDYIATALFCQGYFEMAVDVFVV